MSHTGRHQLLAVEGPTVQKPSPERPKLCFWALQTPASQVPFPLCCYLPVCLALMSGGEMHERHLSAVVYCGRFNGILIKWDILSKSGNEGVPAVEKAWASEPRRSSFCLRFTPHSEQTRPYPWAPGRMRMAKTTSGRALG